MTKQEQLSKWFDEIRVVCGEYETALAALHVAAREGFDTAEYFKAVDNHKSATCSLFAKIGEIHRGY